MAENNSARARAFRSVQRNFARASQGAALRSANYTRRNSGTAARIVGTTLRQAAARATRLSAAVERRRRKTY